MEETTLDRIRKLEAERRHLRDQALAKAQEAVAELNELGFDFELRERRKKAKKESATEDEAET